MCAEDSGFICHDRKGFEREYKTLVLSLTWQQERLGRVPGKASRMQGWGEEGVQSTEAAPAVGNGHRRAEGTDQSAGWALGRESKNL